MPLSAGEKLGPYEILAPIGAGGMGEVYKARDTRLDRIVAIKVSKTEFGERFEREARAVAALNHPNICHLYDVGPDYLVMEYIEGMPLKGPLPVDQALQYAVQICDALDAAHKKGITHRDLKPANVLVTKSGIKLLDFGLAKLGTSGTGQVSRPEDATLTMALTGRNEIVGTLYYMSPEQLQAQANGQEIDGRSDTFSFGLVLFEMLTGKRAFEGSSPASVIAGIMERPAPSITDVAPAALDRVLKRCLEKDPDNRWQSARDLKIELEWISSAAAAGIANAAIAPSRSKFSRLPWLAAALLAIAAGGLAWIAWRSTRPADRPLMRLSVDLGPDAVLSEGITVAISSDGTRLVFPIRGKDGKLQLATRLLDQTAATVLPGTESAIDPFFSPDGQWVGFFADSKMKKISMLGGAPVTLCDAARGWGASWGEDGYIIAALSTVSAGLSRVLDTGGTSPQKLLGFKTNERWPQILPGGETVVFTASNSLSTFQNATIESVSLRTGQRKTLVRDAYFGRYFFDGRSGFLVYIHDGALFSVPFDPAKLELRGTPIPLLEDLTGDPATGAGQFDFSQTGTFVYRSGRAPNQVWPVEWLDNSGKMSPLLGTPAAYTTPRFSPNGQRLAMSVGLNLGRDIFVYDWRRDQLLPLTPAAQGSSSTYPVWAPDGKHIAYRSAPSSGGSSIEWLRSDGSGLGQRLFESKNLVQPYSFSPKGDVLAYFEAPPGTDSNISTIQLDLTDPDHPKARNPELFLSSPALKLHPVFSPNGRWIAYASMESGKFEIYVRSFPASGDGRLPISSGGGMHPMWSPNGRELFYTNLDNRIMVADYTAVGDSFEYQKPRLWSNTQIRDQGGITNLDLAPDGKRFAVFPVPEASAQDGSVHMTFLLNFFDEVRRKFPPAK